MSNLRTLGGDVDGNHSNITVDKGFGFIKDDTGKEYFFTEARCMARDSTICVKATASSSTLGKVRRVLGLRMCDARPPK